MDALTYFNSLKSQGYDDDAALSYTNQHYPDFSLGSANTLGNKETYEWINQNFQRIAAECYPDDEGAVFTVVNITQNQQYFEVVANSNPSIGYDPVRYDFIMINGIPTLESTYTPEPDGSWSLFFSTGNSNPQPTPMTATPTVQSNSVHQAPQQVQTPQPQQMMGQYEPQQPMMQGQPMQAYGQQGMMQQVAKGSRSKIVTFLLAFFLGCFGVHNFYLGKTGLGIAQLLITVLTFGIGVLITGPWAFIEGILALVSSNFRDGDGFALSD